MRWTCSAELDRRIEERVCAWNIAVERTVETESSVLVFGCRGNDQVVAKFIRQDGNEWHCGKILQAFDGQGVVRAYYYVEGAVLLERLVPGISLKSIALEGNDAQAAEVLAKVIAQMSPRAPAEPVPAALEWAVAFD